MTNAACTCIATNCFHAPGKCVEKPAIMGGICRDCRAYSPPPACPTCGRPMEVKPK